MMSVYKKAGHAQPWSAWVPFYRDFVFLEVGGQSGWLLFLPIVASTVASLTSNEVGIRWVITMSVSLLTSVTAAVVWVVAIVNINRAFGKHPIGFTVFAILLFPAWLSALGWGGTRFNAESSRSARASFQDLRNVESRSGNT